MKRKWIHPEEPKTSHRQWRSLGELQGSGEFSEWLEREFPQGAAEYHAGANSRRDFVKLMGASTALAGFGVACNRPIQHLVPFNEHVEWIIPGRALYYSTVRQRPNGVGCDPIVATTFSGRPTKVDGNKLHPARLGGSDFLTQASILDLYDPDRSRGYLRNGKQTTRSDFEESFLSSFVKAKSGEKVAFLVNRSTSPTRNRLIAEVETSFPGARFFVHDALAGEGWEAACGDLFGAGVLPSVDLSRAKRILSVDCDFLGYDPVGEDSSWEFSRNRDVDKVGAEGMNRLYVVEPTFTLTGGMADHRYRLAPSQVLPFLALLAREIGGTAGGLIEQLEVQPLIFDADWIRECAADLVEAKGESVVVVGSRHSRECHLLAAAINDALGAFGRVITGTRHQLPPMGTISDLAKAGRAGEIDTLFVIGESDPAFDAPADLDFASLLGGDSGGFSTVVHLGARVNQTAEVATWHVPGAHYLEAWGDGLTHTGYYSIQQPMIEPMFGGVSEIDFYLRLLSEPTESSENEPAGGEVETSPVDAVKQTFAGLAAGDWEEVLRNGFARKPLLPAVPLSVDVGKVAGALSGTGIPDLPYPPAGDAAGSFEVVLTVGSNYDGRYANNGWLQEAPDPIT